MEAKHLVFDFDCTLSSHHLFKVLREYDSLCRESFIEKVSNVTKEWDSNSKRLVDAIIAGHYVTYRNEEGKLLMSNGNDFASLSECKDFVKSIMGGVQRINTIKTFIKRTWKKGIKIYISTHGFADEVNEILNILQWDKYFVCVHGMDNNYKDFTVIPDGLFNNLDVLQDKAQFMLLLSPSGKNMFYVDDSDDYLPEVLNNGIWYLQDLKKENGGITYMHLLEIRRALDAHNINPMYKDILNDENAIAIVPFNEGKKDSALVVLLDISSSMYSHNRFENATNAISAIAPSFSAGLFVLPWNHQSQKMIQVVQTSDEEEVSRQLKSEILIGGGTNYEAACESLLLNSDDYLSKIQGEEVDVNILFITDSTLPNHNKIDMDEVIFILREKASNQTHIKSINLMGINVFGDFTSNPSSFESTLRNFNSFRSRPSENWITINSTSEIDTVIREQLGPPVIGVKIEILSSKGNTNVRLSGNNMGSAMYRNGKSTPCYVKMRLLSNIILIIENHPSSLQIRLTTNYMEKKIRTTVHTLILNNKLYSKDRKLYISRLYQSVRTNLIPDWINDIKMEPNENITSAIESLNEEHGNAMQELGISENNTDTKYIFNQWTKIMNDAIQSNQVNSFDIIQAKKELEQLLHTPVEKEVIKSVYRKRGKKNQVQRRIDELRRQITEYEEHDQEFQRTTRVSAGKYVPRKYMKPLYKVRKEDVVDMTSYLSLRGECSICFEEESNLYAFKCCKGKTVCGPCVANLQKTCPFCRQSPTFISNERYSCYTDTCLLDDEGVYDSIHECNLNCAKGSTY